MKSFIKIFSLMVSLFILISCSSTLNQRKVTDDLYYTPKENHDSTLTKELANDYKNLDTVYNHNVQNSNPYEEILIDDPNEAFQKRLNATSQFQKSIIDYDQLWYARSYDPNFYNIIFMNGEVWVEPHWISNQFFRNSYSYYNYNNRNNFYRPYIRYPYYSWQNYYWMDHSYNRYSTYSYSYYPYIDNDYSNNYDEYTNIRERDVHRKKRKVKRFYKNANDESSQINKRFRKRPQKRNHYNELKRRHYKKADNNSSSKIKRRYNRTYNNHNSIDIRRNSSQSRKRINTNNSSKTRSRKGNRRK